MKNVNKKQWSRFCRDVNRAHRLARTDVIHVSPDGGETHVCSGAPLLGVTLTRKRGKISDFEATLGQIHNGSPVASPLLLGGANKIFHETSGNNGDEVIEIQNEDGQKMIVRIASSSTIESYNSFVEEMAYFLSEARGFVPGHDLEDWFIAERLIREVAPTSG